MTLIDVADVTFGEHVTLALYYNIWLVAHARLITHVSVSGYSTQNWLSVCVSGYLCDVYGHPLFMKKIIFLIRIIYYIGYPTRTTQPHVPPHILAHAKLVIYVSISGYLCDIYGHPLFMKKNIFFLIKTIYYIG